jgi:choline dehydrogenase
MARTADTEVWDHVIVGAGSAGCALAARLSAAGQRVLLLEAGGTDRRRWVRMPLGAGKLLMDAQAVWRFETEAQPDTADRRMVWPRGRMLGGSSSVNGMIWVHGDPERWNEWGATCPGWDWRAIAPVMRAVEDAPFAEETALRGRGGPVSVERIALRDPLSEAFITACEGVGIPATPDYNGARHEGVGRLQMCTRRGRRCSAAKAYLRPAVGRSNLAVRTGARARRVVFEGLRAAGVEYAGEDGAVRIAAARREVILAAGAIQSPQLLELSGVGDAERLRALGIPVVADLPAVGENLSDHYHIRVAWRSRGVVTVNDLLHRPWLHGPRAMLEWQLRGTGLLAEVAATVHALARTAPGAARPDMKLQIHKISAADRTGFTRGSGVDAYPGVSIGFFQLYPESRGSVHAASRDPEAPPRIVANYLATPGDREAALRGLRLARAIGGQPALAPFLVEETRPGPALRDDHALADYIRRYGATSYHPVGTCRMGSDPDSVVDPSCRVRGVDGLRVADASVMPFWCRQTPTPQRSPSASAPRQSSWRRRTSAPPRRP